MDDHLIELSTQQLSAALQRSIVADELAAHAAPPAGSADTYSEGEGGGGVGGRSRLGSRGHSAGGGLDSLSAIQHASGSMNSARDGGGVSSSGGSAGTDSGGLLGALPHAFAH